MTGFTADINVGIYVGSFIVGILLAVVCSVIARGKGRGPVLWFVLGFFFSCISLVIVLLLPPKERI